MLREHIAAWTTIAFAVLLLLLTLTDQGGPAATALVLVWALLLIGLFVAVEQATHAPRRGPRGRA